MHGGTGGQPRILDAVIRRGAHLPTVIDETGTGGSIVSRGGRAATARRARERSGVATKMRVWARQRRYVIRQNPTLNLGYRVAIGVVGTLVLAGGIVAIPYPGPGWLIVFVGLGILSSEFGWAHRLLTFARGKYDAWMVWIGQQHWSVQAIFWLATAAVVVVTLWLLGAIGMVAGWFNIDADWLSSPILS